MVEYFTFFRSFYEAANKLPLEEKNALLAAILEYGLYQKEPELTGIPEAMFILIRPNLDAGNRNSQSGKKGGRPKANHPSQKTTQMESPVSDEGETPLSEEGETDFSVDLEPEEKPFLEIPETPLSENEKAPFCKNENPPFEKSESNRNRTRNRTGTGNMEMEKDVEGECEGEKRAAPDSALLLAQAPLTRKKAARRGYGEFGWVKLTEGEYAKLCAELGEQEVSRCIRYIDESAQSSQNKNGWKDWNLMVRRCSREGWGKRASPGAAAPKSSNPFLEMLKEESV